MSLYGALNDGYRQRNPNLGHGIVFDFAIVTLDGSNPTSFQFTEMVKVLAAGAVLLGSTAPGLDPYTVTTVVNGTTVNKVDVYAWKATSSANPTLIASTNSSAQVLIFAMGERRGSQNI